MVARDGQTGKQETLHTKDKAAGSRLLHAKNEAHQQPVFNLQIARTYLAASDPQIVKRTWQTAMNEIVLTKRNATQIRWQRAIKDKAFDLIIDLPILETRSEHFLKVLQTGTVSTNAFLRKLHNFTLDMNWRTVLMAASIDGRTIPINLLKPTAVPFNHSVVFLFFSKLFEGKADTSRLGMA